MAKQYKLITAKSFKDIKKLQDLNLSKSEVQRMTGRSFPTVTMIYQSPTFEHYKQVSNLRYRKKNGLETEPEEQSTPLPNNGSQDQQLAQILINLTDAIKDFTAATKDLHDKLDEALESKRPWMNDYRKDNAL